MITNVYAERLAGEGVMVHEKYTRMIEEGQFPIARWGTPEDVAQVVRLVCDDRYVYNTGNYIDVDGGVHIRRL